MSSECPLPVTFFDQNFMYIYHFSHNGSGAHPASYPMGTRYSFPGCKAAGAWSWPLNSI
jgi:hypothetical protein